MDFANEHVGFGTTGTQEELILGMSPETCPIVLFNEILGKKDALLITGKVNLSGDKARSFAHNAETFCVLRSKAVRNILWIRERYVLPWTLHGQPKLGQEADSRHGRQALDRIPFG